MHLSTVLAVVASAVFLTRLLPQPFRLARTGVASGVSALAGLTGLASDVAWLVYGLSAHLPVVWLVSIAALIPAVWTVILLWPTTSGRDALGGLVFFAALAGAAATHLLAGALAVGVIVTVGPQAMKALREDDLTGIASLTWWIAIFDGLSWGAYGMVIGDPALPGYCVVLVATALTVLIRLRVTGAPGRRPSSRTLV